MAKGVNVTSNAAFEFADFMICAHADFQIMHNAMEGEEFDVMHKDVLQEYYDEAADDYDGLIEWGRALGGKNKNKLNAATRIKYPVFEIEMINRTVAIDRSDWLLDQICKGFLLLFNACNEKCPIQMGFQDFLQGRLQYWAKEMAYFNAQRRYKGKK